MSTSTEPLRTCAKFKDLIGCGNCTVHLSDDTNIRKLNISSIVCVIDILLYYCANNTSKRVIINDSTLNCKGDILIQYTTENNTNYIFENRKACSSFIKFWYRYHRHIFLDAVNLVYVSSLYNTLKSVYSHQELKEKVTELQSSFNFFCDIEKADSKF